MERYYKASNKTSRRSEKNRELYQDMYSIDDVVEYSNIEAVAPLEKTNEIDITKVKKMLKSREDYKKQREYQDILKLKQEKETPAFEAKLEQTKNYDIKEELEKLNTTKKETAYHTLDDTSYKILKQLKIKKELESQGKEEELYKEQLVKKLENTAMLNQLNDEQLSLNMFEDLASSGNTVVDNKTITSLLEEAKKIDEKKKRDNEERKIDNSFYTSSLDIDSKDFEGLYDSTNFTMSTKRKIKYVIIGILIAIVLLVIFLILK